MAQYPGNRIIFPVHSAKNEYPKVADRNDPNREIEAICTELGTNPKSISAVTPAATPASVAQYLDMVASAIQTLVTVTNWYDGAVPIRRMIGGTGLGGTVPASSTRRVGFGVIESSDDAAKIMVPFRVYITKLQVFMRTAQPASGSLVFAMTVQGSATSLVLTVAAGEGSGLKTATGSVLVPSGEPISLRAVNNATVASGEICGFSFEAQQTGL
jgi:hypothetical protein